jgi:8-oxo-dGTP pyrophosphatase MutT (NUDIX family)
VSEPTEQGPGQRGLEQRIAAYGLLVDGDRVLMVQAREGSDVPGRWILPGGGVEHGEDPIDTVQREFLEETGLAVVVGDVLGVWSDMIDASGRGVDVHSVSIVYEIDTWAGELVSSTEGHERASSQPIADDDETRMNFVRVALRGDLDP